MAILVVLAFHAIDTDTYFEQDLRQFLVQQNTKNNDLLQYIHKNLYLKNFKRP